MDKTQTVQTNSFDRYSELLRKYLSKELTLEESYELNHAALCSILNETETIEKLKVDLEQSESDVSTLVSAAEIYQEFINAKELKEEFIRFYEGIFEDELRENEPDSEESNIPENDVH